MFDFMDVCSSCPEVCQLCTYMTTGGLHPLSADMIPHYQVRSVPSMHESRILMGIHRLVVPVKLRPHMVHLAYESHQGIVVWYFHLCVLSAE